MKVTKTKEYVLFKDLESGLEYHLSHEDYKRLGKTKALAFVKAELKKKSKSTNEDLEEIDFKRARSLGFCEYGIKDFCSILGLDITKTYKIADIAKMDLSKAIKKYPLEIVRILGKYQTPEICLAAVKQDGRALIYVKRQTPEICLEAVKSSGAALIYVKRQTPEICLEAVKHNGWALKYVKRQTSEICLEAVKQVGLALEFVKNKTPEICLEAVKQDGRALIYVKRQTPEICLEAVKQDGRALKYVKKQTPEICLEAVKRNGWALAYVVKQTPEICLEAVKQVRLTLDHVRDPVLKDTLATQLESGILKL